MKINWNKFITKFHIYGGLFSVGILLAFSYSAFVHQHHSKFSEKYGKSVHWESDISTPDIEDNNEFKLAIRDSLGLYGYPVWWNDYRDSLGIHHFTITRPGKQYWIAVPATGSTYQVEESRAGFLNMLNRLHPLTGGMHHSLNTPFYLGLWHIIALIMTIVLFLVVCISVYFWFKRSFRNKYNWIIVILIPGIPLTLFILIWLVG